RGLQDHNTEPIQLGRRCTNLLDCLTTVATSLPSSSLPCLVILFEPLCRAASSRFDVVRYSVVRCYAELCKFLQEEGMLHFIYHVLPLVGDPVNLAHCQGAIEMLSRKPTFSSSLNGEY
ncbi:hypothetical protein VP01_4478g2, partial [Puccinia sorghi]